MQRNPRTIAVLLGLCLSPLAFAQQSGQSAANQAQPSAAQQGTQSSDAQGAQQSGAQQSGAQSAHQPGAQDGQQSGAQQSDQMAQHPPVAIQTVVVAGTIDSIDRDKRTVTLKGQDGQKLTIHAGPDVKDFDQLKQGRRIVARYTEAYALDMKKGGASAQQAQAGQQGQGSQQPSSSQQAQGSQQPQGSQQAQGSQGSQQAQSSQQVQGSQQQGQDAMQAQGSPATGHVDRSAQSSQQSGASSSQQGQGGQPVVGQVERLTVFGRVAQVDSQSKSVIVQVPNGDLIRLKVQDQQAMSDLQRGDEVAVTYVQAAATALTPSSDSSEDTAQQNGTPQQPGGSQQQ